MAVLLPDDCAPARRRVHVGCDATCVRPRSLQAAAHVGPHTLVRGVARRSKAAARSAARCPRAPQQHASLLQFGFLLGGVWTETKTQPLARGRGPAFRDAAACCMQRAVVPRAAPAAPHLPRLRPLLSGVAAPPRACAVFARRPPPHGLRGALRCCAPAAEPPSARRHALVLSPRSAARPASSWRVRAVEVRHPSWNPKHSFLTRDAAAGV